ncbi:hypothetical protein M436DRAFT_67757 [Aureobasidium namibiae CBS 147.97]|uniref:F-box domain-containing protein n=1 Tax=Aureobasidium namibiae CBS 147.97 TaxID=1043004 RepID=A0A074W7J1_9PEZI
MPYALELFAVSAGTITQKGEQCHSQEGFKMYRSKPEDDEDDYTAEEVAKHKKFIHTLLTTKKVNFMDFPPDVRNRVYEYALEQALSEPIIVRLDKDKNFDKPRAITKLNLNLMRASKQVHDEVEDMIFSRVFKFANLDIMLAFLVQSATARQQLRHVDIQLESGPFDLNFFALLALSNLNLHTLTLRCHAVQGPEEDWIKSLEMNVLLETRGVGRVTLAPVDPLHHLDIGSLTGDSELGKKLITLLQRPAHTSRRDPALAPIMPDVIEQPSYPCLGYSVTDFEDLEDDEPSDLVILDPLCISQEALWWCDCIANKLKSEWTPDEKELHWSQLGEHELHFADRQCLTYASAENDPLPAP